MTYTRPPDLPNYENPPVVEVEVGIAFQPLSVPATRIHHLLEAFREELPHVTEESPEPTRIVRLADETPELRFEILDRPPLPRIVLADESGSQKISLQSDSLRCQWTKVESQPYPTYSELRKRFAEIMAVFEAFIDRDVGGELFLAQCHISFTNLTLIEADNEISALAEVLKPASNSSDALGAFTPDSIGIRLRKNYTNDVSTYAALFVNGLSQSAGESQDAVKTFRVRTRLMFAGSPFQWLQSDKEVQREDLFEFFDHGHHEIVSAFTDITRPDRHQEWGRTQ